MVTKRYQGKCSTVYAVVSLIRGLLDRKIISEEQSGKLQRENINEKETKTTEIKRVFVCLCVFFPLDIKFVGRIPAGVTQEEGHT